MKNARFIALALLSCIAMAWETPLQARPGEEASPQNVNQAANVTGVVVDETGEPMLGVTIKVEDSNVATVTDLDGNFSINMPSGKNKLLLSYVGYKDQTVVVKSSRALRIEMEPDENIMDEVVVVGYGTVKKRDLTGAISSVKSEEIKEAPVINAMEALIGKVSGLDIVRESGQAGTSPSVLLRGNRSLNADCSPLYVIDGISGGSIDNINPNDIESIEVLKDASSTAIYGSAGANGVIIVTTKQGTTGKVQIDFDAYVGINAFPSYPSTLSGQDWIDFLTEGYIADNGEAPADISTLFNAAGLSEGAIEAYNNNQWIDWKDEILQTGIQQNYNVSIRGGSEKQQSYASVGYMQEKGVYRHDKQDQLTFRGGTTYNINKIVTAGFQSTITYKNRDRRNSRLNKTLNQIPLGELYDENGELNYYPISDMTDYVNLLVDESTTAYQNNTKTTALSISPFIEIKPFKGFSYKTIVNASFTHVRQGIWDGLDTYMKLTGSSENIREASYYTYDYYSYQWQNIVNYNFKIAKDHDITLTGITEYTKNKNESASASNEQFEYDDFLWYNLSAGLSSSVSSSYEEISKMSFAGRINYSYLGRYLLTASIRWDGASQLFDKWCAFPAVAAAWRISDEPFMKVTRKWLDNLKLRVGYGMSGNANIDPYVSLTAVTNSDNYLNLGGGQIQSYILAQNVANSDLTWEKSYNWNIGLDFSVLRNRIDGSIELYYTDTKGVLYNRPLPTSLGSYNAKNSYYKMSNIARIKNNGLEITINSRNIVKKNFKWSTTLTFATNSEKLKEINLGNNTTVDELIALNLFLDEPVNTFYGYKKAGIWQLGQEDQAACFGSEPGQIRIDVPGLVYDASYTYTVTSSDGLTSTTYTGAYYKPEEDTVDEDGNVVHTYYTADNPYSVSSSDKQILGSENPDWTLGLHNTFEFYNFDLTIMLSMRWGQMVEGDILSYWSNTNIPDTYDYWTESNPTNAYPRPDFGNSLTTAQEESLLYADGSFLKVKNITLGYTLPKKALKKIGMSKLRFYATVSNPFIWCKDEMLDGLDPENVSDKYPLFRTIVFGVNASF